MACLGHMNLRGPLACSPNLQPLPGLVLRQTQAQRSRPLSPAMVETVGPDVSTHQGLSMARQQEAIWVMRKLFGPFGVQHCTWSPSGLRAFAAWWTQADGLPHPLPKTAGSMAWEGSGDGWAPHQARAMAPAHPQREVMAWKALPKAWGFS